jgi:hypothetical protein
MFEPERAEAIAKELERFLAKRAADRKKELTRQQRRLARLKTESRKLLQLAYKDAIPDDVFEVEQTRIKDEMKATEQAIAETNVSIEAVAVTQRSALKLLTDCERAYRAAGPKLKRQYNQSFFKAIYIGGKDVRVELAEPFAKMLEFDFMRRFNYDWDRVQEEARAAGVSYGNAKNPTLVSSGQGSNYAYLVDPTVIKCKKSPQVEGESFSLVKRHGKRRREGYVGCQNNSTWAAGRRRGP